MSCATASGPLFEKSIASEEEKEEKDSGGKQVKETDPQKKEQTSEEEIGVYIESEPIDAEVLVNNFSRGETPLVIDDLDAGEYSITLQKEGYEPISEWFEFDGDSMLELSYSLEKLTGYLFVSTVPEDALVFVDGEKRETALVELTAGTHSVWIGRFGYTETTNQVEITADETVELRAELKPAPFTVYDQTISRETVNPDNPGTLGTTEISFSVSAPGSGECTIYDQGGDPVLQYSFPPFSTWEQSFRWDGTDPSGTAVPDGEYLVVLRAAGESGETVIEKELAVIVDRSAVISYRSLWSGSSGLLYSPGAEVLPPHSFQLSMIFLGHVEEIKNDLAARFPTQIGFRYAITENLELNGQGTVFLQSKGTSPFSAGLSGKYRVLHTPGKNRMSLGITAKATYLSGETLDTQTNYTGISFGVPVHLTLGIFHAIIMPEIVVSSEEISYNLPSPPGFYAWGYGRAGFLFDFSLLSTGFSAAFRTKSFTREFALQLPFNAGWELHWFIPKTQMVLSAAVAGEFAPALPADSVDPYSGFYLMTGIGLGFIN